jgi:hypothetical protein
MRDVLHDSQKKSEVCLKVKGKPDNIFENSRSCDYLQNSSTSWTLSVLKLRKVYLELARVQKLQTLHSEAIEIT